MGDLRQGVSALVHEALDLADVNRAAWVKMDSAWFGSEVELETAPPLRRGDVVRAIALLVVQGERMAG